MEKLRKDMDRDSSKYPAFKIASDYQEIYDRDGRCKEFARHIDNVARKNLARKILAGIDMDRI